tara:strand:+ start:1300 stop:3114 length:1815 start_codon:yes stop_codon:yes gene_type:complete
MDIQIIIVFLIIGLSILLFITEFFPIDKIAFLIIGCLVIFGLTSPEEAISGFSNSATITILCLMIIAIGLEENGVIQWLTDAIKKLKLLPLALLTPSFMIISAGISAFISTTAVVIIFIKIVSQLAEKYNLSSSKLLMPISFAGILGGSCTLMGTSTNLLVNAIAKDLGAESLGFFEFAWFGLILLVTGILFMTFASFWLPKEKKDPIQDEYGINDYVFSLSVGEDSKLIGKRIEEIELLNENATSILKLVRAGKIINGPGKYIELQPKDNLILMSSLDNIGALTQENALVLNDQKVTDLDNTVSKEGDDPGKSITLIELLILPGSHLIGKNLADLRSMSLQGAFPLAIKKRVNIRNTKERMLRKTFGAINTKPGDRILLEMQANSIAKLYNIENVAILNQHESVPSKSNLKKSITLIILLMVIGLAASGVLSILAASILGVASLLITKSVSLEKLYHKINWQIIFLLAGMIPLGIAMTNSGTDQWISENLLSLLSGQRPMFILGILFLFTMILSGTISNNATAIIMTPIAISVASGLQLPLKPFILAVMFAANYSFFTPVGYQTNTLIYGTGAYKFKHFLIIGGLLSVILWIVATLLLSTLLN